MTLDVQLFSIYSCITRITVFLLLVFTVVRNVSTFICEARFVCNYSRCRTSQIRLDRLMVMTMYTESYKYKTRHFTISAAIIVSIELIQGAALALISDCSTTQATYKLWSAEAKECKTSHFLADFLPSGVFFSCDSVFTSHKNSRLKKRVVIIVARGFNIRRIDLFA